MNENILIVDDEKEIADLLEVYLKNDGYTVYKFYNGTDALKCIRETDLDLAILDVMLPDIDGFHICQQLREEFFFPVIMLTAKVTDGDKIMGLTIGADDYITKPFNPLEVVARVKTQLRRYVRYNQPISGLQQIFTMMMPRGRLVICITKDRRFRSLHGVTPSVAIWKPHKNGH